MSSSREGQAVVDSKEAEHLPGHGCGQLSGATWEDDIFGSDGSEPFDGDPQHAFGFQSEPPQWDDTVVHVAAGGSGDDSPEISVLERALFVRRVSCVGDEDDSARGDEGGVGVVAGAQSWEEQESLPAKTLPRPPYSGDPLALVQACEGGQKSDLDHIRHLIVRGIDVNAQDPQSGRTALINAIWRHKDRAVVTAELVAAGADVNTAELLGTTPLDYAVKMNHPACSAILRAAGAIPREEEEQEEQGEGEGVAAACVCGGEGDGEGAEDNVGGEEEKRCYDGPQEPQRDRPAKTLPRARYDGHPEALIRLFTKTAEEFSRPSYCSQTGAQRRIMNATERFKECRDLLARGIDVHARDHDGRTALLHAAKHGYGGVVDELLRAGADPNARDNRGSTGLIYATAIGYESIATALIGAGAAVDVVDNFGRNALCLAAANRAADTVTAILQTPGGGRLLDVRGHPLDDSNRMAPLVAAAAAGSRSVVRVIIKYLIQQNQLLAPAAVSDADMPADAGPADAGMPSADKRGLNVRGARGATALINAAAYGDLDMVRDLVHAGAALDLEDDDGNTALRVARDHHHEAVRQLLIAAGARCPRSAHRARS